MRTSAKRAARNRHVRSKLRTAIKKVRQADSPEAATAALREASSLLDRAAAKNVIHANKAARAKSRLAAHTAGIAAG
ncbi:30S ribosomal protein S20 [soil metagenome]